MKHLLTRRHWLGLAAGGLGAQPVDLIASIERTTLLRREDYGQSWFHPRACLIPGAKPRLLMTLQAITGSDVFHTVHWMESSDMGRSWTRPAPIAGTGWRRLPEGIDEGMCDTVPEYHAKTGKVLALAHNVYYKDGALTMPGERRWPLYLVFDRRRGWKGPFKLEWKEPRASAIYTSGCSQRVELDNGELLVPLSYGSRERKDRQVCVVRCRFDGERLEIVERGNDQTLAAGRGLLEPSLTRHAGRVWMTIRAEDGRGYVTTSSDGLEFAPRQAWTWTTGEPLEMSTTQQHWLTLPRALYLVYTRKAESNQRVMRWRTPLWIARVDEDKMALIRETEQIVFPQRGDGGEAGMDAWLSGNFHPCTLSATEAIVTDGQINPARGYTGDVLLARLRFRRG